MTTMMIAAALIALAVALTVALVVGRWWPWRVLIRRRVLIVVDGGAVTIDGVLWQRRGDLLVVRDATVHHDGAGSGGVAADGSVVIERRRVDWMQVP